MCYRKKRFKNVINLHFALSNKLIYILLLFYLYFFYCICFAIGFAGLPIGQFELFVIGLLCGWFWTTVTLTVARSLVRSLSIRVGGVCCQTARGNFSLRTERCELSFAFKQAAASGSDASAHGLTRANGKLTNTYRRTKRRAQNKTKTI